MKQEYASCAVVNMSNIATLKRVESALTFIKFSALKRDVTTHFFNKSICFFTLLYTIFLLSIGGLFHVSHASEKFTYESVFPSLQQPWHFWHPSSVAATASGNLVVADTGNNRIVKFNPQGQLITTWGRYGHGNGEFDVPSALSMDSSGNIYVLDTALGNNRVLKFDQHGKFVLAWGKSGAGEGEFSFVTGQSDMAISLDDEIYISDTENNRIQKFSGGGDFLGYLKPSSEECPSDCQFYRPSGLAFDSSGNLFVLHKGTRDAPKNLVVKLSASDEYQISFQIDAAADNGDGVSDLAGAAIDDSGNLYVADITGHRILIYSPDGVYQGSLGSQGSSTSQFSTPMDLCFGSDGKIYITDRDNNRIEKFSQDGEFINSWTSSGSAPGMFDSASGIAVDGSGNIFVADTENHRVQKLDLHGNVLMVMGEKGDEEGKFNTPRNVAVDFSGNIYVADKKNHRIQKFDGQGLFIKAWGSQGDGDGEFTDPVGVAVDSQGNVYVADSRNYRIQKFTSEGLFLSKWGESCESKEQNCFKDMEDIVVDYLGNVYVSDQTEGVLHVNRIQKFTRDGEFLLSFGEYGSQDGELNHPFGLAVDTQGNIHVADLRNYRVEKFSPQGLFLGNFGEFGSSAGQFLSPVDVAVTPEGKILVLDAFTNTIQQFKQDVSTPAAMGKKALIVAGGGPYTGNTLWDTTKSCANFAYRTLRLKGYAKENIYYLCDDDGLDLDGNGLFDDVHGKPGMELMESIITQTASDADELLLYFVDHGQEGSFSLDETERLTASSLDQWLDSYEASSQGRSTLIYDACQSGSFISSLTPYKAGTRTVVTSARKDQYAYFVSFGTISFSEYFWTALFNGHDMTTAFRQAQSGINLLELSQTPQLDANGNGVTNEDEDYDLFLSQQTVSQSSSSMEDVPIIGEADAVTLVDGTGRAIIEARGVMDSHGIERVWATIIPPDHVPDSPDVPVTELPEVELKPLDGDSNPGTYQSWYETFTMPGIYRVTIHARDIKGNSAVPVTTVFVTSAASLPKAVIVTTHSDSVSRASIHKSLGEQARSALMTQGFSQDRIYSMHAPQISEVASAITQWAVDSDGLILFFAGQGSSSGIELTESETISPSTLNTWLDQFQDLTSGSVNVVIDADNSGGFIKTLAGGGREDGSRIVVASTAENGKASFESQGLSSFSSYFWNAVFKGANLWDAFLQTGNAVSYLTQSLVALGQFDAIQIPQMDDNGNGVANEDDEGANAALSRIGLGIITGADSFAAADIEEKITLEGSMSATLSVENIRAGADIVKVWALVTPPAESAVMQVHGNMEHLSLPLLHLMPDSSGKNYQWMYSAFDVAGTYYADYHILDSTGSISFLGRTEILQTIKPDPSSQIVIQGQDPVITAHVPAHEKVTLNLVTALDLEVRKSVVHEWLVVALSSIDGTLSFYLFSPSGLVDLPIGTGNLADHTFDFDHSRGVTTLGTLTPDSLRLGLGDILACAYVYSVKQGVNDIFDPDAVYGNIVVVFVN